jgi:predicted phage tail protein
VIEYCPPRFESLENLGIIHNGKELSPERAETYPMFNGDEVIFYRKPRDPATSAFIALTITAIVISVVTQYAIQALTAPSARSSRKEIEDSETYGFDGIVNTVRPGTRIPLIYGTHRVGGQIIQQFLRQQKDFVSGESADPKGAQISSLIAVGTGPVEDIREFRINRNAERSPDTFADGVMIRRTLGDNHQTALDGFDEVVTQVTKDQAILNTGGELFQVTTQNEVDYFEIVFRFAGGLFETTDRGQLRQKRVEIRIEYRENGAPLLGPGSFTGGNRRITNFIQDSKAVTASTRNPFDVFWRSPPLGRAKYDIRVTRTTPDDTAATGVSDFTVLAINEIVEEIQTYPRVALYSVEQLPTNQISGAIPQYDALVQGKLVRVYTNLTNYNNKWSDNPAWCLLDFLTNKFDGLGAFVDDLRIDLQSFIDTAAFCDDENLKLNIVLDGSLSAFDSIRQICTVGRMFFLLRGDKWAIRPDRAEDPVQFFSMGRIGQNTFSVQRKSRFDKANYFLGEFWNAELDYERDTLPKEDPTLPVGEEQIEASVNLLGVTSTAQANKVLNYIMLSSRLQLRTVEFEAGIEALAMEAADVFAISHDVPGWGFSGKLREVDETGTSLWLDRVVTIEAGKDYELTVVHDKTEVIDVVRVTNVPETTDRVTVSGDWTTTPVKGQDYSFGELTKSYVKYRCTSITRGTSVARRKIRGVQYDENVYGEDLTVLPAPSASQLPDPLRIPPDVKELRLSERQVYAEDGTLSTAIDVFYTLPIVAGVRAEVFWREPGFQWESVGIFTGGYATITQNIRSPGARYEVAVASISQFGARKSPSSSPSAQILTIGVTRQPDNVDTFRVDRTMEGLVFSWVPIDPVRNFDLAYYEIRTGAVWETAIKLGQTRDTVLETSLFAAGDNTYLIKAYNRAGKSSPVAKAVVISIEGRIGENIILTRIEEPTFPGVKESFIVVANKLQLVTESAVVAWRALSSSTSIGGSKYIPGGRQPGFRVTGSYTTDIFQVTTGNAVRAIVSTVLEQVQVDASLFWNAPGIGDLTWESDFARTRSWGVAPEGRVKVRVEMRFSTATSAEADFGPWQERAQNIEVLVKHAQARIHVEVTDPAFTVEVSKFQITFDVPETTDAGRITTSSSGVVNVTFVKFFNNAPRVTATIQSAQAGDDLVAGNPTTTGFPVSVFNAGSRVVRDVEWIGVGF